MSERLPAQVFHPSEFIQDELDARGWSLDELAARMGGDFGINRLSLDLYFEVGPTDPNLRIGRDSAVRLAHAFGVSSDLFLNLESAWLKAPEANRARAVDDAT